MKLVIFLTLIFSSVIGFAQTGSNEIKFSDDANELATLVSDPVIQSCFTKLTQRGGRVSIIHASKTFVDKSTRTYFIHALAVGGDVLLGSGDFQIQDQTTVDGDRSLTCNFTKQR